jgi:NAD(P)H-flavin reductase
VPSAAEALTAPTAGNALTPRPFVVRAKRRETADTVTLWLEPRYGDPLAFRPGQFTMIGAPGRGEVPISISGDPREPELLQHTVRSVGDASRSLTRAEPGDVLLVRGPFGTGWDVERAAGSDVLVVAGGIGLAPLRPALLQVLAQRDRYERAVLLVGCRTPDQLLYVEEVQQWRARLDLDVLVTVDAAPVGWHGRVGLVTGLLGAAGLDPLTTHAFVCGPEVMMRFVAEALVRLGVPSRNARLSMERNMKCGVGLCGHCQLREHFVCTDGPVFGYDVLAPLMTTRGL